MFKTSKEHVHIIFSVIVFTLLILPFWSLKPQRAEADIPSGLVVGYSFDEGSGATAADINSTYNGTISGATWVAGKYGTALSFDGINDYVSVGTQPANLSAYTWTGWVKTSVFNSGSIIVTKWTGGQTGFWVINLETNGSILFTKDTSGTNHIKTSSTANAVFSNSWTHIAITWDGTKNSTSTRIYANGNDVTGTQQAGDGNVISDLGNNITIGSRADHFFNGFLDEIRIYNRVLGLSEIQADMNTPTDTSAPSVPSGLSATAASSTQISLSWTASTDNVRVSAYKIYRGGSLLATTTAITYLDSNLTPASAYSYTVSAYDPVLNESSQSSSANATTLAGPDTNPPSRSNGSPSGALTSGTTQGTISLNTNESATCKYASSTGVSYSSMANTFSTTGGTTHSQLITGLSDGNSYNYYIRCQDSVPNTNTDDYQISFSVPSPGQDTSAPIISGVSASTVGINTATIVWTTSEAADSQVEYGTSTYDLLSGLDSNLVTNHSVVIFGLKSDSTYNFRAKSKDDVGNLSVSGNFTFTTSKAAGDVDPPTISDISAVATYATATITWTTDEPATSRIEYGFSTTYTASTTRDVILKKIHSVTIGRLESRTKYNFRVISDDVVDNRTISGNFSFTTDRIPASLVSDPVITKVSVVAVRPTSAKIDWITNVPATSQVIFGETDTDLLSSTLEQLTLTTTHSVTVSDLNPKTKYFFKAASKNAADTATTSLMGSFQTPSIEIQQLIDVSKPDAKPVGSAGTQTPRTSAGETVTAVPILLTKGDVTPPEVILFNFSQNPTENTSPRITGRAIDKQGVIAAIAYSTDGGASWHPISTVTGIGTSDAYFAATIPNLNDGNYPIMFRAKDNSDNAALSRSLTLVVNQRPPGTGANALFLGTQSIVPTSLGSVQTLSGIVSKIVTTAFGGVTGIDVIATRKDLELDHGTSSARYVFPLAYLKSADLWHGDIKIDRPGSYDLKIKAVDGTGDASIRSINPFSVATPGMIIDSKTEEPLQEAEVFVFQFAKEQNKFVLWPGEIYTQENPQVTGSDGIYRFILPPGKYYLKARAKGYQTLYTDITELKSHGILSLFLPLTERPYIKLGKKKFHFPTLPDFFGSKRVKEITTVTGIADLPELSALMNAPAPIFDLPDVKGISTDLRYLRGKKTVLTVWSTWSPLAQAQVPVIDEIQRIEGDDVKMILVSLQESEGLIDTYLRRGGYNLTAIVDREGKFADQYPVLTIPQHFFIDRRGIVRGVFVGFLDKETLIKKLSEL